MCGLNQRLEAVDRMCTLARDSGPVRDALLVNLCSSSGLHSDSANRLFSLWLERCQRVDLARITEVGRIGAVGTVGVVAPGNLCVATWQAVTEALLCGNRVIVRPGSGDPLSAGNLKRALAMVDGEVAACIEVLSFERDDRHGWQTLASRCDAIAVYGSDEAVEAIQGLVVQAETSTPVRCHGHKVSLAWLPAELIDQREAMARWARGFAHDVLVADGRGCMSLRALLTDVELDSRRGRELIRHLREGMASMATRYRGGSISSADLASRRLFWEEAAFTAANAPSEVSLCRDEALDWAVVMRSVRSPLDLSMLGPGSRLLTVCAVAGPVDLAGVLAPLRGHLSTLARPVDCSGDIDQQAHIAGFTRLCVPGRMQAPAIDRGFDGHPLGAFFVRSVP